MRMLLWTCCGPFLGALALIDGHIVRRSGERTGAGGLKILATTYNAGNDRDATAEEHKALYAELAGGHEEVDLVVLGLQEHSTHFRWPVADMWPADLEALQAKFQALNIDAETIRSEVWNGTVQEQRMMKMLSLLNEYPSARTSSHDLDGYVPDRSHYSQQMQYFHEVTTRSFPKKEDDFGKWWQEAKEALQNGPEVVPEWAVTFESGMVCHSPVVSHFDTTLRVFARPGLPYHLKLRQGGSINNIVGVECGKVVNYAIFSLEAASKTSLLCVLNTHMSFAQSAAKRAEMITEAVKKVDALASEELGNPFARCDALVFVGDFNTRSHCEPTESGMHYSRVPPWQRASYADAQPAADAKAKWKSADPGSLREVVSKFCTLEEGPYTTEEPGAIQKCLLPQEGEGLIDELTQFLVRDTVRCYEKSKKGSVALRELYTPGQSDSGANHPDWMIDCWCAEDVKKRELISSENLRVMNEKAELDFDGSPAKFPEFVRALARKEWLPIKCYKYVKKKGGSKWGNLLGGKDKVAIPPQCRLLEEGAPDAEGNRKITAADDTAEANSDWKLVTSSGFAALGAPGLREAGPVSFTPTYRHGKLKVNSDGAQEGLWKVCYSLWKSSGWPKLVLDKQQCTGPQCATPLEACIENPEKKRDGKHNAGYTDRILLRGELDTISYGWQALPTASDHGAVAARLTFNA